MPPVREVATGVWHWEAPHPEQSGEEWLRVVSSYAIDDGDRLLLFDPPAVPGEIEELAAERETAILLTCPWHRRDALSLAARLGVQIYVPPPDEVDPEPVVGQESRRALVAGDTLVDRGNGLEFRADWASEGPAIAERGVPPEQIFEGLRPLLELPVELVLATHGGPADRAALERALS
jgi:hypothetical protein